MDDENYDGADAKLCPFCDEMFSADTDKCLTAAIARIAALEAQLKNERDERFDLADRKRRVEQDRDEKFSRLESAESALAKLRTDDEMLIRDVQSRIEVLTERAEKAETVLAAAREDKMEVQYALAHSQESLKEKCRCKFDRQGNRVSSCAAHAQIEKDIRDAALRAQLAAGEE